MGRRLAVVAVGAVMAIVLAACGDDGSGPGEVAATSPYPPTTVDELAEVFDPQLEPLGLHLTRGALIDRSDGGYVPSDEGRHLALYVEPLDDADYDTADYVEGIGTVTALVTPQVFERWSAIQTYDICQEPPAAIDGGDEPAPYTQIEIGRAMAEVVAWDEATTETVLGLSLSGGAQLIVTPVIAADPDYLAAQAVAG